MNAAAVLLIWHFPIVLVPFLPHMSSNMGSSHYWVQVSFVFKQCIFPDWPLVATMDVLLAIRLQVAGNDLHGGISQPALVHMKIVYVFYMCREIEKMKVPLNCVYLGVYSGLGV